MDKRSHSTLSKRIYSSHYLRTICLLDGTQNFRSYNLQIVKYCIRILNLHDNFLLFCTTINSADPYVRVSLLHGDRKVKKKKTSIKKNDCDPLWNEEILFNIPLKQLKVSSLEVKFW